MREESSYSGESYYDLPAVKPSHYRWEIVLYFFIGGVAAAAQFLASIADLTRHPDDRGLVRSGRYIALAGALVSPILLIADLQHPRRWFNMLRIYRGTSPMSIGSWALSLFGAFSGLAALGQFLDDIGLHFGRTIGRLAALPAAVAGAIVALYTGTLLAATNLPFVAAAFPWLSSLFASSAASTAAAALTLANPRQPEASRIRLSRFALVASLAELAFETLVDRNLRKLGMGGVLEEQGLGLAYRIGVQGFGIGVPLAGRAYVALGGRLPKSVSDLIAVLALTGGFILRAIFVFAGNRSVLPTANYLQLTQPENEETMMGRSGRRPS